MAFVAHHELPDRALQKAGGVRMELTVPTIVYMGISLTHRNPSQWAPLTESSGVHRQVILTKVAEPKKHPPLIGGNSPCHRPSHISHTLPHIS